MRIGMILLLALALAACQGEEPAVVSSDKQRRPATTSAPAQRPAPTNQEETGQPAASDDPQGWEQASWAGLTIPIPPRHSGQELPMEDQTIYDARVVDSFIIAYNRDAGPQSVELPSGLFFRIVEFSGTPQEWVDLAGTANQLSVDAATVKETTVAGRPALAYNPTVTGTGLLQNYVVQLDAGRLLLIDADIIYEGYEQVIEGIRG